MGDLFTILTLVGRLVLFFLEQAREKTSQGIGYTNAMKDVLEKAHLELAQADAAEIEARTEHDKHPEDDSGFDATFKRD